MSVEDHYQRLTSIKSLRDYFLIETEAARWTMLLEDAFKAGCAPDARTDVWRRVQQWADSDPDHLVTLAQVWTTTRQAMAKGKDELEAVARCFALPLRNFAQLAGCLYPEVIRTVIE